MHEKARYRRLLLFVETCEAETLTNRVYSPNVLTIATSKLGAPWYHQHLSNSICVLMLQHLPVTVMYRGCLVMLSSRTICMSELATHGLPPPHADTACVEGACLKLPCCSP